MATGVHQFFDELEAKKTILSKCTDLFTTLSTHFSSLQHSVTEKSQSFNSLSKEILEFVHLHKTFILKCESSAAAHIEEQREATLALQFTTPISISFFTSGSPSPSRNNKTRTMLAPGRKKSCEATVLLGEKEEIKCAEATEVTECEDHGS
ncbi:hypothetical protein JHK85_022122 [Glycine max]|nr:hypothetical protein JHK85_022122 [Glycine max]